MDISVVVPLLNEEESLPELAQWIARVMQAKGYSYEVILIDDGSTDNSWQVIEQLATENNNIKGIKLTRNYGKSGALHCGFEKASGNVVITMDADLQDCPDEIPELYNMVAVLGFDVVSGWKKKRLDNAFTKNLPSKFYNATARLLTGLKLHDMNCGLKAYKNRVVKSVEVYGDMHRYIPVLAHKAGFKKIGEKEVLHQKRKYGETKFGLDRFINGPLDLITILFMSKFGKRPMHFFGMLGTFMFIIGVLATAYLGGHKVYLVLNHIREERISNSPYFFMALVSMVMGTQLFLAGFIGEMVSRSSSDRNKYLVEKNV